MVFFNWAGLAFGLVALAIVWGIDSIFGPSSGAAPLVAAAAALVCLGGLFYDRLAPEETLRAYYLWVRGVEMLGDVEPFHSRVALLGVPLILWPATAALFGLLFPLFSGDALPPPSFFLVALATPLALLVQAWRAKQT